MLLEDRQLERQHQKAFPPSLEEWSSLGLGIVVVMSRSIEGLNESGDVEGL